MNIDNIEAYLKVRQIFDEIEKYAQQHQVKIEQYDFPRELKLGYRSSDGKIWKISIMDMQKSNYSKYYSSDASKQQLLDKLNGKQDK